MHPQNTLRHAPANLKASKIFPPTVWNLPTAKDAQSQFVVTILAWLFFSLWLWPQANSSCETSILFKVGVRSNIWGWFCNLGDSGLGVRQVLSVKAPKGNRMCTNQLSPSTGPATLHPSCCPCASLHAPRASVGSGLWALAPISDPVYQSCLHLL